jgi:alpha-glucosidase
MARQSGERWFLGALNNGEPRDVKVQLDFLGPGRWKLSLWKDGANASENAEHLATEERTVTSDDEVTVPLASAGGFVARLQKQ